mgnify:CR=1 FL=1
MKIKKIPVYKKDCFAYIQAEVCGALSHMKCENCSFYKNRFEVDKITKKLINEQKELLRKEKRS